MRKQRSGSSNNVASTAVDGSSKSSKRCCASPIDRRMALSLPRRLATLVIAAIPLLLAAATLALEVIAPHIVGGKARLLALASLLAVPVLIVLTALRRGSRTLASRLFATPALLAPVAVCFPWTVAPSHLGLAFGDLEFFLHWLTKYPTWGRLNHEVLLGILCVLGCAFLPWLAAVLRLYEKGGRAALMTLLGLVLIPYIPVLIRLDVLLFIAGLPLGVLPAPPIWVVFGPVLRLASILSMIGMLLDARRAAPDGGF